MSRGFKAYASLIANIGLGLALGSAIAAIFSGMGTRCELWNFRVGLLILKWSAYGGLVAAAVSLAGCVLALRGGSGIVPALIGIIVGAVLIAVPAYWVERARRVPPIHDITTDTSDPPQLVATLPLRKKASNPPDYGGPQIAAQQRRAYPDITPLVLEIPPEAAFEMALAASRKMGWKIIDADRSDGRIEAVDTTFWFGFSDDIVIRIKTEGQGCRVDIRSVSRVGISDVGTNATRIRKFFREMRKK
jgi:uncharacterized protein (DUF1499 family)